MKNSETSDSYFEKLRTKMDTYVYHVYDVTKTFPKDELFGITSQVRRAAMSVILNFIEGYARRRTKEFQHSLDISYASLQESQYLLLFSKKADIVKSTKIAILDKAYVLGEEIGATLWGILRNLK